MKKKTCLVCGKILKNQGMGGGGCTSLHTNIIFSYGYYLKGEFYISEAGKKQLAKKEAKVV